MLTKQEKTDQAKKVDGEKSPGCSSVQAAILTRKIEKLIEHTRLNKSDKHSRVGLLNLVEKRRKHLKYLKRKDRELYEKTSDALGLKKN